eukprot:728872-Pelagomonas_calceolata.AAC.1
MQLEYLSQAAAEAAANIASQTMHSARILRGQALALLTEQLTDAACSCSGFFSLDPPAAS